MKILALGDVHGDLQFACRAVDHAVDEGCTAILQAGDFGIWTHTTHGVLFLEELNRYLAKSGMLLYFVDGNHENFDHLYDIEPTPSGLRIVKSNIIHIPRGHRFEWDGVRFMGFGGANSIDGPNGADWWGVVARGVVNTNHFYSMDEIMRRNLPAQIDLGNWWPQEEITQEQVDAVSNEPVDVLISHDCPAGINIPGIEKTYLAGTRQRKLLREVVDKVSPRLVIHGHYHIQHSGRLDNNITTVYGLGDNTTGRRGYIVIDTEDYK